MGNSSSSNQLETNTRLKWIQSLEPADDSSRNRMKRSYFQTKHNGKNLASTHKVLPSVTPTDLRLRPTSNGAILQGGGTISGRNVLGEVELVASRCIAYSPSNKKLTNISEDHGGKSQQCSQNDSNSKLVITNNDNIEASLRSQGKNSFDSNPSKKQIPKKKYPAPLPPATRELRGSKRIELRHKGSKRLNHRFNLTEPKVKENEWEDMPLGACSENSKFLSSALQLTKRTSLTPHEDKHCAYHSDSSNSHEISDLLPKRCPKIENISTTTQQPLTLISERNTEEVDLRRNQHLTLASTENKTENTLSVLSATKCPTNRYENGKMSTFYFGMSSTSNVVHNNLFSNSQISQVNQKNLCERNCGGDERIKSSRIFNPQARTEVGKCYSETCVTSIQDCAPGRSSHYRSENLQPNKKTEKARTLGKRRSRFRSRISGSDSSSDFSSSETEIPPVIRPTLPQKRNDLPSFSPVSAWQALESPHISGTSASSGDGNLSENHMQQCRRSTAPNRNASIMHERSGDSGISAGEAGSPAYHFRNSKFNSASFEENLSDQNYSLSRLVQRNTSNRNIVKCWTPQQDLDDSGSEFEPDIGSPSCILPVVSCSRIAPIDIVGPSTPPKLTTRSNLFHQNKTNSLDTRGRIDWSDSDRNRRTQATQYFDSRRSSKNQLSSSSSGDNRKISRYDHRKEDSSYNKNPDTECHTFSLDTNWYLSRSEPSSLNETPINGSLIFERRMKEVGSEIGYGPSNLDFNNSEYPQNEGSPNINSESNSLILFRKPLHIMYLPSYDSRRLHCEYPNQRRSKSVDNLDGNNVIFQRPQCHSKLQRNRSTETTQHETKFSSHYIKNRNSQLLQGIPQTQPLTINDEQYRNNDSLKRVADKSKFKFQSTLRVLEKKRIEKEICQEAKERENKRLREEEELRRVEVEFQKKRLKDRLETNHGQLCFAKSRVEQKNAGVFVTPWDLVARNNYSKFFDGTGSEISTFLSNTGYSSNKYGKGESTQIALSQRQEPDGAPAVSSAGCDIRKEVIQASRKRNATIACNTGSDLTQELSEYRQETRQYCDYRRNLQHRSSSPIRFGDSSNSSLLATWGRARELNCSRTTIHPEVVVDIPVKRHPYCDSRLTGSLSNILRDVPSGSRSGPSSVISDNYRRDWAHKTSCGSTRDLGGAELQRTSSIISLHSAPGHSSIKHAISAMDLTANHSNITRDFQKKKAEQDLSRSSHGFSGIIYSSTESIHDEQKWGAAIKSCAQPVTQALQPRPFIKTKVKEYRPVIFKPKILK